MIVYKLTSPSGKCYIGKTVVALSSRLRQHKWSSKVDNTVLYGAVKKYGIENFKAEAIETCYNLCHLNERERFYIKLYKSNDRTFGYNMTEGGDGIVFTQEIKDKISRALKGRPSVRINYHHSEETKAKIGNGNKGKGKGGVGHFRGHKHTQEAINLMAAKKRGIPAKNRRSILCVTTGQKFCSLSEAAKFYGVLLTSISNNLSGRSKKVRFNDKELKFSYV